MSPKLEKSEFKIMLTDALMEAIDPQDLPKDPKQLEDLAKLVVNESIKLSRLDNHPK